MLFVLKSKKKLFEIKKRFVHQLNSAGVTEMGVNNIKYVCDMLYDPIVARPDHEKVGVSLNDRQ